MTGPLWPVSLDVLLLGLTAVFCAWLALVATRRRRVAGAGTFALMMLALVIWTGLSAVHRLPWSLDTRVLIAQFQVVGIVAVAPLWFLFGAIQAQRPMRLPVRALLLWIVPVLVVIEAAIHGAHGWYWTDVVQVTGDPADGVEYFYGPLFWVSVVSSYGLIVAGTGLVLRSVRESPPHYRRHMIALAGASLIPLAANALYLARVTPDFTPMAFALSGGIFGWSLFHRYLLNVRPVARTLLFERFVDAVFVLDTHYAILDFNAAAERLTGTPRPGQSIRDLLPWWDRLVRGETRQVDGPSIIRHEQRALDAAVTPISSHEGQLAGWLVVVRDVTDRLRAEEERAALNRRLQEQQHVESLTALAGGLAHDFNNLLAGIMGNADMLAIKLPAEAREMRDMAHAITVGAERAADLVAKMLAYAGEGAGPSEPVDIDALARDMVDLLRASVARRTQLAFEPAGGVSPVLADATQIRQVILNLIVNAAEAIEQGDEAGRVTLRTGEDTLPQPHGSHPVPSTPLPPGRYAWLEVSDTGAGMSPETATRMFDPFFTTKSTGRGLGLASVQGIVRQHRGAVGVTSTLGHGTTIRVWFPVTP